MRTPIAVLHGIAGLAGTDDMDGDDLRAMMRRHVGELDWLVNQFLDFVSIEAGQVPTFSARPNDVMALVDAAVEVVATSVPVAVEADADLRPVHVDAGRTRQILAELLNNAIRVSPPGGVAVRLRARAATTPSRWSSTTRGRGSPRPTGR